MTCSHRPKLVKPCVILRPPSTYISEAGRCARPGLYSSPLGRVCVVHRSMIEAGKKITIAK